jgi:hypothetical protein
VDCESCSFILVLRFGVMQGAGGTPGVSRESLSKARKGIELRVLLCVGELPLAHGARGKRVLLCVTEWRGDGAGSGEWSKKDPGAGKSEGEKNPAQIIPRF